MFLILLLAPLVACLHRDLVYGDLNFLHTTDTHGWYGGHLNQPTYDADWGDFVSFAEKMRNITNEKGVDLLLIDTGDRHDGNGLSDSTTPNGHKSLPIFIKQTYDVITLGNHELYEFSNSAQEYDIVASHYGLKYISTNVEILLDEWTPFNKYRYFTTPNKNLRVLSLGILFDFNRPNNRIRITPIRQLVNETWFLDILESHRNIVDTLVVIGHIPIAHDWTELTVLHRLLRSYFPSTPIEYFGGHSHIRDFAVYDTAAVGLQSGRFCESVGFLSVNLTSEITGDKGNNGDKITTNVANVANVVKYARDGNNGVTFFRRYIDFAKSSFLYHSNYTTTAAGEETRKFIKKAQKLLQLNKVLGKVNESYYMDYVPMDHPRNLFKLLTDKVLPTLQPQPEGNRVIIINTGSIRYDLYKGDFTLDTKFIISPFKNEWISVKVAKDVALRVADYLNGKDYIALKSPHQAAWARAASSRASGTTTWAGRAAQWVRSAWQPRDAQAVFGAGAFAGAGAIARTPLKGYVTHDDWGTDGDDTVHRPVVNFPVPNVVQSVRLVDDGDVELVFYSFLRGNVEEALDSMGVVAHSREYSLEVTGDLLERYFL